MKPVTILFSLTALASAVSADSNSSNPFDDIIDYVTSGRVCPNGFTYAGEDTQRLLSAYWTEEVARSPVYSCYKLLSLEQHGFNEALTACNDLKADLVSLEDTQEVNRVIKRPELNVTEEFVTSALFFADVQKWIWLGSNQTEVVFDVAATKNSTREQCLKLTKFDPITFVSVECNQPMMAMCEVRVQTVTYLAWFYSNWLSFLLVLMTVLLMSALCISVFKYKSGRRVYRSRSNSRPHRVSVTNLPYNDAPPTYNDVTGTRPQTTMDKYKNKGKEVLAKVTLYKNTTNETNHATPNSS